MTRCTHQPQECADDRCQSGGQCGKAHPKDGHVYKAREDGVHWSFVARWKHPAHQAYHVNWTGEYAIVQVYGNFKNELRFVEIARWDELFELAWEPATICKFCGFTRMRPCLVRQTCANLADYRLEPDDVHDDPEQVAAEASDVLSSLQVGE